MVLALVAILAVLLVFFLVLKVVAVLTGLVWLLLVAALCGAIAEHTLHYKEGGIGTTVVVGLVGALLGWLFASIFHLPTGPHLGTPLPVLWTIVGSFALVGTMKVVSPVNRRLSGRRDVAHW